MIWASLGCKSQISAPQFIASQRCALQVNPSHRLPIVLGSRSKPCPPRHSPSWPRSGNQRNPPLSGAALSGSSLSCASPSHRLPVPRLRTGPTPTQAFVLKVGTPPSAASLVAHSFAVHPCTHVRRSRLNRLPPSAALRGEAGDFEALLITASLRFAMQRVLVAALTHRCRSTTKTVTTTHGVKPNGQRPTTTSASRDQPRFPTQR